MDGRATQSPWVPAQCDIAGPHRAFPPSRSLTPLNAHRTIRSVGLRAMEAGSIPKTTE